MIILFASLVVALASQGALRAEAGPAMVAEYYVNAAGEGQQAPIRRVQIRAYPAALKSGPGRWWEMTLEKPDGGRLALRVLSDRVPLTPESASGIGKVWRYIYSPAPGEVFEYVDPSTGAALLPDLPSFRASFLPKAYRDARYIDGFATSGTLLGHSLVRYKLRGGFPEADLSHPRTLKLDPNLLIGSQADERDDRDPAVPVDKRKSSPYTLDDYKELISAGANYFNPQPELRGWIAGQPVFFRGPGTFPDDFYRSNFLGGRHFIDEPGIRFGWEAGVPQSLVSPDVYANALTNRVAEAHRFSSRAIPLSDPGVTGSFDLLAPRAPIWETLFATAYYQLRGGSPGLVFEGRYVHRGYGWSPEMLLGEGLDELKDLQQFDYFHGTLRGAARATKGFWGTSVYPEGEPKLMGPAFIHAYDNGARALWFWNYSWLSYTQRLKVLKELQAHVRAHPRNYARALNAATTAIVLPAGYVFKEDGVTGVHPEQVSPGGASYSEIAAAALFHGILLSRGGVEYDTVYDFDGLKKLGYGKLIYIRESGKVEWTPKRPQTQEPVSITVAAQGNTAAAPTDRQGPKTLEEARPGLRPLDDAAAASTAGEKPDGTIDLPSASGIKIDGTLDDWSHLPAIRLDGPGQVFCDNWTAELDIKIPEDANPGLPQDYLGFTWDQITPDYRRQYRLEGYSGDQVVVTSVQAGSATDAAGLREGDVILFWGEKNIRWAFEVWGKVEDYKRRPGQTVHLKMQRGGIDPYAGAADLSGWFKAAMDADNLYIAADIADDTHYQTMRGQEMWMNDCLQIGIDPTGEGGMNYTEDCHEIGLALADGKPIAYRWKGRRGQPVGGMPDVEESVRRSNGHTIYEARVPISLLTPLSPTLHPVWGMSVVVNDSDNGESRKQRLELNIGAMTAGKRPSEFTRFAASSWPGAARLSSAIHWQKRSSGKGRSWEVAVEAASDQAQAANVSIWLVPLDGAARGTASSKVKVAVDSGVQSTLLQIRPKGPPGRYRMHIAVREDSGRTSSRDTQIVYLYQ